MTEYFQQRYPEEMELMEGTRTRIKKSQQKGRAHSPRNNRGHQLERCNGDKRCFEVYYEDLKYERHDDVSHMTQWSKKALPDIRTGSKTSCLQSKVMGALTVSGSCAWSMCQQRISCDVAWETVRAANKVTTRIVGTLCADFGKKYDNDGFGCFIIMQQSEDSTRVWSSWQVCQHKVLPEPRSAYLRWLTMSMCLRRTRVKHVAGSLQDSQQAHKQL